MQPSRGRVWGRDGTARQVSLPPSLPPLHPPRRGKGDEEKKRGCGTSSCMLLLLLVRVCVCVGSSEARALNLFFYCCFFCQRKAPAIPFNYIYIWYLVVLFVLCSPDVLCFFFFSFFLPAVELELASVCCGFYFVCVPSSVCTLLLRVLKTRRLDPTLGAGFVGSGMSKHSGPRVVWHGIYFRRLPRCVCVCYFFFFAKQLVPPYIRPYI